MLDSTTGTINKTTTAAKVQLHKKQVLDSNVAIEPAFIVDSPELLSFEDKVDILYDMGFSREDGREALGENDEVLETSVNSLFLLQESLMGGSDDSEFSDDENDAPEHCQKRIKTEPLVVI